MTATVLALALAAAVAPASRAPTPAAEVAPDSVVVGLWRPAFGLPRAAGDHVAWRAAPALYVSPPAALADPGDLDWMLRHHHDPAAWERAGESAVLAGYALRERARRAQAAGDSAAADSLWARLAARGGLWTWEAISARADLALAAGDGARADRVLDGADRSGWPDADRAAWLARVVERRAARGDTAGALEGARQALRRYPALSPTARALGVLERLEAARGERLPVGDERAAAEVEYWQGGRASAAARLGRALERAPGPERWRIALRRGEILRALDRLSDARRALRTAERAAPDSAARSRVRLERARVERDGGRRSRARRDFAEAAALATEAPVRETARWERARELEDEGRWSDAGEDYARVAEAGERRADEAAFRAGLMALADGDHSAASRWLARAGGEGAEFWRAVLLRASQPARGDSLLAAIARRPGYGFYRAAARETLGVTGWPGAVAAAPAPPLDPTLRLAADLVRMGRRGDALEVLDRWAAGDARLDRGAASGPPEARTLLTATAIAYHAGSLRQAIRLAQRAFLAAADSGDAEQWAVAPWAYPPAFDSLFAAWPERAAGSAVDRPLLQAMAWKESHFDPAARSRAGALGLLQLLRPAVTDVSRWLGERAPRDSALLDPALNLRYGARYFEHQLERFGGRLPVALAAYNAGAGAAARWTRLRAVGGDALACEEIGYGETEDYVKTILGVRQAYRELAPREILGRIPSP